MLGLVSVFFFLLIRDSSARTVHYSWDIGWVTAAPDGFPRPVIGVNGQWPCPELNFQLGDRVIIDVYNGLGNQSTGIHWHGFFQEGTPYMDGAIGTSQCSILPGSSMTYDFIANQSGTYWWHAHIQGQYPDGLWGPMIVHDPKAIAPYGIDDEIVITLTDWYHEQMSVLSTQYQSEINTLNNSGSEPVPQSGLINTSPNAKIHVLPNKTYLVRVICVGNWPGHTFLFDEHELTVVEVDGVWLEPYYAGYRNVRVATGQRMSFLLHTKNSTERNFALWNTMDINMLYLNKGRLPPADFNPNVTAHLIYNESAPLPNPPDVHEFDFVDDVAFTPYSRTPLLEPVDHYITFDMNETIIDGLSRFVMNGSSYYNTNVPSLYTAMTEPYQIGTYNRTNPFIIESGSIVQIVINNRDTNLHPFHLHGHNFQVLQRADPNRGYFNGTLFANVSSTPMIRDTIMVQYGAHTVLRFKADNPGVWLLHCHIEWHVETGLVATMIEAPELLSSLQIPKDQLQLCRENSVQLPSLPGSNYSDYNTYEVSRRLLDGPE